MEYRLFNVVTHNRFIVFSSISVNIPILKQYQYYDPNIAYNQAFGSFYVFEIISHASMGASVNPCVRVGLCACHVFSFVRVM